tara:strand:+ start:611 stop:1111 length:501 start_codon:yes stop_codon:yes gene_type:complete
MKVIPHSEAMVRKARKWSKEIGSLKNSITSGKGNLGGRVGEIAFASYVGADIADDYNYDLILNGEKIEIKTKRRTVAPKGNYEVSVATTSLHQKPDRYVFISVEFKRKKGFNYYGLQNVWLCGDMKAKEYLEKSWVYKKGDMDESNKFVTLVDMHNLSIDKLDQSF